MSDDQNDNKPVQDAQDAASDAEKSEEKAQDSAKEAQDAAKDVKEEVLEDKKEEKKEMPKVSKKLADLIGNVEKLSVLELSELVKALEVKFGVSAAPVAVAGGAGADAVSDEGASEQTTFNVIISEGGANRISVIKAVRELVPTLGLKEAKDLVDAAPKQVLVGVNKETATEAKSKLETAGAKVELK